MARSNPVLNPRYLESKGPLGIGNADWRKFKCNNPLIARNIHGIRATPFIFAVQGDVVRRAIHLHSSAISGSLVACGARRYKWHPDWQLADEWG